MSLPNNNNSGQTTARNTISKNITQSGQDFSNRNFISGNVDVKTTSANPININTLIATDSKTFSMNTNSLA